MFVTHQYYRIIPMRVGTRYSNQVFPSLCWDHPHACGDKFERFHSFHAGHGSSPCVWGQANIVNSKLKRLGIIPMRVGTRIQFYIPCFIAWDHPHACGDKVSGSPESCTAAGSSPCVWGQGARNKFAFKPFRIIPMRVGTSAVLPARRGLIRDHPHACGDKRRTALRLWH